MLKLIELFRFVVLASFLLAVDAFGSQVRDLQEMAETLTNQFTEIASLMIAVAYVAGIGFGITAIFKFKQHKDNPTQVQVGIPFAMLAISVLLIFLPAIYVPAGASLFGAGALSGSAAGDLSALPGSHSG